MEARNECVDCNAALMNSVEFCLVTLENEPLVVSFQEFYRRMIEDSSFAEKLGFLVSESKTHPGVKGLFNYRKLGLSLDEAKKLHDSFVNGSFQIDGYTAPQKKKIADPASKLASTYYRTGRITYRDSLQKLDGMSVVRPLPKARVEVVVYYVPAGEETWGYATTDYDGYYTVQFTIPNGQSLYENLVGVFVYTEDQASGISVEHPSTGLYMEDVLLSYNYNVQFDESSPFYCPAIEQYGIMNSYNFSSNGGFGGGNITVYVPDSSTCGSASACYSPPIYVKTWDTRYAYEFVSHEHGHHLMNTNMGFLPYGCGGGYDYCGPVNEGNTWCEGWARFWGYRVCMALGLSRIHDDPEPNPPTDGGCGDTIAYPVIAHAIHALWDLYDGDSEDEPYSYYLKMDDALKDGSDDIYEYIADLKDQYESSSTKTAIENAIQLNLPPSPGGLLLASAGNTGLVVPHALTLEQNSPNPFNPATTINFTLSEYCPLVSLIVYDIRGKKVVTLSNGAKESGSYAVFWDGDDNQGRKVASGVYFYKLRAGERSLTRKMVLLK